ncbi:hypothetical protein BDF20DRAFT_898404 [Mycotypha africana]|uniref:uncharacterized protein n=1 Tax=Mycotypha africana TaxID=64632 RepID=UPI0022FFCDB9|nr:uncharacterized protein BDF20DRAFT_898404 [Mycotypha africana]KAI8968016.1 hypothetical protein BDF20DRAFT_898404 [Mycotypha africana]
MELIRTHFSSSKFCCLLLLALPVMAYIYSQNKNNVWKSYHQISYTPVILTIKSDIIMHTYALSKNWIKKAFKFVGHTKDDRRRKKHFFTHGKKSYHIDVGNIQESFVLLV